MFVRINPPLPAHPVSLEVLDLAPKVLAELIALMKDALKDVIDIIVRAHIIEESLVLLCVGTPFIIVELRALLVLQYPLFCCLRVVGVHPSTCVLLILLENLELYRAVWIRVVHLAFRHRLRFLAVVVSCSDCHRRF